MSKFARDNNVFFEFHSNYCVVKSQVTNEVLLQGSLGFYGLYVFPNFHLQKHASPSSTSCHLLPSIIVVKSIVHTSSNYAPCTNSSNNTHCKNSINFKCAKPSSKSLCISQSMWHIRLGHPNSNVLKLVIKQCNVPLSNKIVFDFYSACCIGKSHRLPSSLSTTSYNFPLKLIYNDL